VYTLNFTAGVEEEGDSVNLLRNETLIFFKNKVRFVCSYYYEYTIGKTRETVVRGVSHPSNVKKYTLLYEWGDSYGDRTDSFHLFFYYFYLFNRFMSANFVSQTLILVQTIKKEGSLSQNLYRLLSSYFFFTCLSIKSC
jgi:hypothetical protein